jgi:secreted trypsin-like serine protease
MAVLTAAHLFKGITTGSLSANIVFQTTAGTQTISATSVTLNPNYDSVNGNNDLAIVWLSQPAPVAANRYQIYHQQDEIGQTMTMVGYGLSGNGNTGDTAQLNSGSSPSRLMAKNTFDADAAAFKVTLGNGIAWTPTEGTQLVADFDNGNSANDALGRLIGVMHTGLGADEGLIAPGDSGGPAFLKGQIAGVASYTASLNVGMIRPDVDNQTDSSFGEIAAWQRVSNYQQWIDQTVRAQYPNAPTTPEAVQKQVFEGNGGVSYAYFLLQFTGVRTDANQKLMVDYATRDGTATAGQDYLATSGTLVLYPNEAQTVVAVEILGDTLPEPNETFYLDVTNPIGGSFGEGVAKLTAMRTILNDDGLIA